MTTDRVIVLYRFAGYDARSNYIFPVCYERMETDRGMFHVVNGYAPWRRYETLEEGVIQEKLKNPNSQIFHYNLLNASTRYFIAAWEFDFENDTLVRLSA